jgi:predicted acetyltransferase
MARLSDVAGCLSARGYHADVDVAVALRVIDETLPDNDASYRLEVSGGKATVEQTSEAPTSVTVGGLAAMFTSSLHPYDAVRAGFLHPGSDADVEALAAAFAGPAPWLIEFF